MADSSADLLMETSQRISVMRAQEVCQYVVPDYLAEEWQRKMRGENGNHSDVAASRTAASAASFDDRFSSSSSAAFESEPSSEINELWREKICEWFYHIADHYDFSREVVSVAMSYLDRYVAKHIVDMRIFQLAAMTALYLAVKLYEQRKLRISTLIDLSQGYHMAEHFVYMENSMLQTLSWYVHPPTPYAFCRDLMNIIPEDICLLARKDINQMAQFLTELSVCDYWFVKKRPSCIAVASIATALELQESHGIDPNRKVDFLCRVNDLLGIGPEKEILECYERLHKICINAGFTSNLDRASGDFDPRAVASDLMGVSSGNCAERDDLDKESAEPHFTSGQAQERGETDIASNDARAVSPNAIISENPSGREKRKTRPSILPTKAKRMRKNLNRTFYDG